jgi:hypothetical protein
MNDVAIPEEREHASTADLTAEGKTRVNQFPAEGVELAPPALQFLNH